MRTTLPARLRSDETGQTLVEYALVAVLVSITASVLLAAIGVDVQEYIDPIEDALGFGDGDAESVQGDDDAELGTPAA